MGRKAKGDKVKLIVVPGQYSGYLWEDIESELGPRFADFQKWFAGQTGAIHEGKPLVYQWDYDRWQQGLPVID